MMTKTDMIDAITRLNRTARPAFLAEFSTRDLQDYLDRLRSLRSLDDTAQGTRRLTREHDPVLAPTGTSRADRNLALMEAATAAPRHAGENDAVRAGR